MSDTTYLRRVISPFPLKGGVEMSDKSQITGLRGLVHVLLEQQGDLRGLLEQVCQAVLEPRESRALLDNLK